MPSCGYGQWITQWCNVPDLDVLSHNATHLHERQHALRGVDAGEGTPFTGFEVAESLEIHAAKLTQPFQ